MQIKNRLPSERQLKFYLNIYLLELIGKQGDDILAKPLIISLPSKSIVPTSPTALTLWQSHMRKLAKISYRSKKKKGQRS